MEDSDPEAMLMEMNEAEDGTPDTAPLILQIVDKILTKKIELPPPNTTYPTEADRTMAVLQYVGFAVIHPGEVDMNDVWAQMLTQYPLVVELMHNVASRDSSLFYLVLHLLTIHPEQLQNSPRLLIQLLNFFESLSIPVPRSDDQFESQCFSVLIELFVKCPKNTVMWPPLASLYRTIADFGGDSTQFLVNRTHSSKHFMRELVHNLTVPELADSCGKLLLWICSMNPAAPYPKFADELEGIADYSTEILPFVKSVLILKQIKKTFSANILAQRIVDLAPTICVQHDSAVLETLVFDFTSICLEVMNLFTPPAAGLISTTLCHFKVYDDYFATGFWSGIEARLQNQPYVPQQ